MILKAPSEDSMTTHSSILAWGIPWTEKPSGLQSMGSQIAGHDWSDLTNPLHKIQDGRKRKLLKRLKQASSLIGSFYFFANSRLVIVIMTNPEADQVNWGYWLLKSLERSTGEGNGSPFQYSCLENPVDGEAWWAAVYGVSQSPTRLKWLSSSSSSIL